MLFETYFRLSSYGMVACGVLALATARGVGPYLLSAFIGLLIAAWLLEGTRWQLSERAGLAVVLIALPVIYFDWKYHTTIGLSPEKAGFNVLIHLIFFLSAVKLIQAKTHRDWAFLYLIAFFELLLAAGLSVSPMFLAFLGAFVLFALSTFLALEIRKSRRLIKVRETRLLISLESTLGRRWARKSTRRTEIETSRLPYVAVGLLVVVVVLACPIFLVLPRFGTSAFARADDSGVSVVGFSDEVSLGDIGRLKQSEQVVMRVRVDNAQAERNQNLLWRGVALDRFDGRRWSRSVVSLQNLKQRESGLFPIGTTADLDRITTQTFYIEPVGTRALFAAWRAVALQGALPYVQMDADGALATRLHGSERLIYRAFSDTQAPGVEVLRNDSQPYPPDAQRYLALPEKLDPRIKELARRIVTEARAANRYDEARAVEAYLRRAYGYTLSMKSGGADPLADFLFNVREGHCEYFSTAMAIMLRTRGIATRVVNGFLTGEYNDAADVYTVRQSDAHSWVEVYFPASDSWVSFDPTPSAGDSAGGNASFLGGLKKYAEALEMLWVQYVIAYDGQEQRELAKSLREDLETYREGVVWGITGLRSGWAAVWQSWGREGAAGEKAFGSYRRAALAAAGGLFVATLLVLGAYLRHARMRPDRSSPSTETKPILVLYERMTKALEARGFHRTNDQTPLEFALSIGMPEVLTITRAYNRVRYGAHDLTPAEMDKIESWLQRMERVEPGVRRPRPG
jgi:hypothetical protein